jgi:hypothetical protein
MLMKYNIVYMVIKLIKSNTIVDHLANNAFDNYKPLKEREFK